MEAFSLLKYWKGGGAGSNAGDVAVKLRPNNGVATIITAVGQQTAEADEDEDDDGPFFDLEFAVPDEEEGEVGVENLNPESGDESDGEVEEEDEERENEREFNFTVDSCSGDDRVDPNLSLSPSDDLFFKGKLVPIESSEPNSKTQFPVSLLKSATKFRVFMSGLKKSRFNNGGSEKTEQSGSSPASSKPQEETQQKQSEKQNGKFFTVKFKVEEVPIVSLFTRDNSSRISSGNKTQKPTTSGDESTVTDEKRFTKEVMQKYLKKVKPLYVRVSKRYGEKLRFSGQLGLNSTVAKAGSLPPPASGKSTLSPENSSPPPASEKSTLSPAEKTQVEEGDGEVKEAPPSTVKSQKQVNFPAGLRVVCKHLGKSRSASSTATVAPAGSVSSKRRDDSLLQQQDGIQSAILHCKRSFNASRDSESSMLSRSSSDPSNEKSLDKAKKEAGKLVP
ncbi:hypothetical protein UlMin_002139 [Ulmus minor]